MSCHHDHTVNETRTRSLLKAISGRIIEVTVGALVFGTLLSFLVPGMQNPYIAGLGLNIVEETICFVVSYFTDRAWNKIQWGREVEDIESRRE